MSVQLAPCLVADVVLVVLVAMFCLTPAYGLTSIVQVSHWYGMATLLLMAGAVVRSWWNWVPAADANDKAALQRLENRLSMEEIAHFRAFVAAQSSKLLIKSETHLQHAVDAVDAVVANLGTPLSATSTPGLCIHT